MKNPDYRIPDDMAAEVLAESARLYAEANKGYSFADLQQACADIQIPPHIIKQAVSNVEEKRSSEQLKRQQFHDYLKTQVNKGISTGLALLVPAISVSGIFIFRHQLKPAIGGMIAHFNPSLKTLTVKTGKLVYLTDPKGLSISMSESTSYQNNVKVTIRTDGYSDLEICPTDDDGISNPKPAVDSCPGGKLGGSYEYQGIYHYRIKIIEIKSDSVVFQIEQLSNEPESALSQSQKEVKQLKKERKESQIQTKELQDRIKKEREESQIQIKEFQDRIKKEREESQIQIKGLQDRLEEFRYPGKKLKPPL